MKHTWRWYGPNDRITLQQIRQTGATGIVTALHHIPNGQIWTLHEIQKRKEEIELAGLTWDVVESVPVHEDIKKHKGNFNLFIENYKASIRNLGQCGIKTICYNFMPVLDWSRTDLQFREADGSLALRFDMVAFVAFDVFILKRPGAEKSYKSEILSKARAYELSLSDHEKSILAKTIIAGLPGSEESYTLEDFQAVLDEYRGIDAAKLKEHLFYFLQEIIPIAEASGVKMAIHPDDPPVPILGLPRVVSTLNDAKEICAVFDSPSNGLTFCTGSFGAGYFNNLESMVKELAPKINFLHLRNVSRDADGNFKEEYFFNGDTDMYEIVKESLLEEQKSGRQIPVRPDHGNQIFDDIGKQNNPGYSLYGRMKGLAEIRGLEIGIKKSLNI